MQKTLTQMSEDYFQAAKDLDEIIAANRMKLKEAYTQKNYLKVYDLKRKLKAFYDQRRDIMTIAYKLKNYYGDAEEMSA